MKIAIFNSFETFEVDDNITFEELQSIVDKTEYHLTIADRVEKYYHVSLFLNNIILKYKIPISYEYKGIVETMTYPDGEFDIFKVRMNYNKLVNSIDQIDKSDKRMSFGVQVSDLLLNSRGNYEYNLQLIKVNGEEVKVNNVDMSLYDQLIKNITDTDFNYLNMLHPNHGKYIFIHDGKELYTYDDFIFPRNTNVELTYKRREKYDVKISKYNFVLYGMNEEFIPNITMMNVNKDIDIKFKDVNNENLFNKYSYDIYIATLNGKIYNLSILATSTIEDIKTMIEKLGVMSYDQQRLIFGGKQLEDYKNSHFYGIKPYSYVHLVARLRGGGIFNNVEQQFVEGSWSRSAPKWRECRNGINIEGRCLNDKCEAFMHEVIDKKGFAKYNLDTKCECPICRDNITAKNLIITSCNIQIIGKEVNKEPFMKQFNVGNSPYMPENTEITHYDYLTFIPSDIKKSFNGLFAPMYCIICKGFLSDNSCTLTSEKRFTCMKCRTTHS